jgi:glycosyltransferase involved in cell wall biosynthesis
VASVLGQTFADLELIVVDDASSDDTARLPEIVGDPRLRYLRRPQRGGAAAARNSGIAEARAGFVAFLDSDDVWLPDKLERQVPLLSAAGADVALVYGGLLRLEPDRAPQYLFNDLGAIGELEPTPAILRYNDNCHSMTWLVRRAALAAAGGFDESLPLWEDWELMIRLAKVGRFIAVDEVTTVCNATPGSLTTQHHRRERALARVLAGHGDAMRRHPRAWSRNLRALARFSGRNGNGAGARRAALQSLRSNPFDAKTWGLLLLNLLRPTLEEPSR